MHACRPGLELHLPAGERDRERADARRLLPLPRDRHELGRHHHRRRPDVPGGTGRLDAVLPLPGRRPGDARHRRRHHHARDLPGLELDARQHHDRHHDAATGNTNLQVGLVQDENTGAFSVVSAGRWRGRLRSGPGHRRSASPSPRSSSPPAAPSNFNLIAGLAVGQPIITLPIKIHLENPGPGAELLHRLGPGPDPPAPGEHRPVERDAPKLQHFDPNGSARPERPAWRLIVITGAVQGDDTFAVPGAQGCGPNGDGSLDSLVNSVVGLPSPSGNNHLVLDDASSALAAAGERRERPGVRRRLACRVRRRPDHHDHDDDHQHDHHDDELAQRSLHRLAAASRRVGALAPTRAASARDHRHRSAPQGTGEDTVKPV